MSIIERITQKAKEHFKGSGGAHDWEHTKRVRALAVRISEKEGGDREIIEIAAVLHDIARCQEDRSNGKTDHAVAGAEMSKKILKEFNYPSERAEIICRCIETHRFRSSNEPQGVEAKVLFDADKLDSIGAVGIGRAFLFAGEVGAKLHNKGADIEKTKPYTEEDTAYREYMVKLRKVSGRMMTIEGKRLAAERHAFMEEFFNRINKEVDGEL